MNKETKKEIAQWLLQESLGEFSRTERLYPDDFESNDHYKVCYRAFANMLGPATKDKFGLDAFPTLGESIEIIKMVHPYFQWLEDNGEGWRFENMYEHCEYAWDGWEGY